MPRTKRRVARNTRDYVVPGEVDRLLRTAIRTGRHAHRNYCLILLCYRHGLRPSELVGLRWRAVDFNRKQLRLSRSSNGLNSVHPLRQDELKALRKLKKDYPRRPHLFVTDRGTALTKRTVSRIIAEVGEEAGLKFHVTPKMLRRGCGHALAKAGHSMIALQHYLGHKDIRYTARYMELPAQPFKNFWKD